MTWRMSHDVILVLYLCPGVHVGAGLGSKEGRCGKLKSFAFCHAVAQALFDSKKVFWCNFPSLYCIKKRLTSAQVPIPPGRSPRELSACPSNLGGLGVGEGHL